MTFVPLTRQTGRVAGLQAGLPAAVAGPAAARTAVARGLRVAVRPLRPAAAAARRADLVLAAGEAAEFDTRVPHAFADRPGAGRAPHLFGPQGERMHVRARPKG